MNFVSYITLYLLLFDLDLPFMRGIGSAPLALIISTIMLLFKSREKIERLSSVFTEFKYLSLIYFLLLFFALSRILIDGAEDISYLGTALKGTVIFIASLAYLSAFNTDNILNKLFNVFFINASIALFVGTFQEYQPFVDLFKPSGGGDLIGWTPYRNAFLAGSGYFGIGAPFAIAIVFFICHLFNHRAINSLNLLKVIVIIVAGVFAARTVFICIAVPIIYLIFIKRSVVAAIVMALLAVIIFFILDSEVFTIYRLWLFEIFEEGLNSSSGSALLSSHLVLPDNILTFLLGDGKYINMFTGGYYMGTDIGYLRHWFFGGLFFVLLVLSIPMLMYLRNRDNIFLYVIIPVCFILHFKGVFIYNNPVFTPLLMIISHALYIERLNQKVMK